MQQTTDSSLDSLAVDSCSRARQLIEDAEALRTRHERSVRKQFVRLFRDPDALQVTISLTDEVMRFTSIPSAVTILRRRARRASITGFGLLNAAGLRFLSLISHVAPSLVVKIVHSRVRGLSSDLILDADQAVLRRHIQRRRSEGMQLNINVLGEAVLGEREAHERLQRVLEMMRRPEVNYVSVKLSALVSQIVTVDWRGSLDRVALQLRELYREAELHHVFVNLDMEEYRDLRMTVEAFEMVLSEPEFAGISAGIVLQAYLPDSHDAFNELVGWAKRRFETSGGRVKIRLVKGANLAMEHAEAELHGWTPAPYPSKADVDASYARLLDLSLRRDLSDAIRIGVASHNLFHVTWALDIARIRGVEDQLDIEMLEGMSPSEAMAIVRSGRSVLLYAPVTRDDDFAAAVAYLVRRLDENTSEENYLRAAFSIAHVRTTFEEQQRRFLASVEQRHQLDTTSRRHAQLVQKDEGFYNAADGDPTRASYVQGVDDALRELLAQKLVDIGTLPVKVDEWCEEGGDPSRGGEVWYRYHVATRDEIDEAVGRARFAGPLWEARGAFERSTILRDAALVMEGRRASTIAVMSRDAGKTVAEGDPEASEGIDFARYYASLSGNVAQSTPLGVVLVVPPWNFPFAIPTGGVCAALAAGNAVILKPAPEAVAVAWEIVQQLWAGGVPRDVLQFVPTRDDDNGRHLVTHPDIDGVILTGSYDTARLFTSWKPDLNLLAETSGKNSIIVTACADIDLAVKDVVQSAFGHAGQKCSAASLVIVESATYENPAFLAQLVDAVTSLNVGPAYDFSSVVGPIIRPAEAILRRALTVLDEGESWLVEPLALDDEGLLWRPGVKTGVRPGSWSHLNEWFGPVLGVMVAPDLATAIAWQNQVAYGLTGGIHSLDEAECQQWIEDAEAGNLYVNRAITGAVVQRQPFGGWKRSSVGPTAKAGGSNYVNCLRRWPAVVDVDKALHEFQDWWTGIGSQARDEANLEVERNVIRYRHTLRPTLVRIDATFTAHEARYVLEIARLSGAVFEFSANELVKDVENVTTESVDDLVARSGSFARVRWLSREAAPIAALLEHELSTDRRPLAQSGAVEGSRWLMEQSVAIVNHRYGNVHAGPKPNCLGLSGA